jgi:HD-like signal output (HDOD) protein
VVLGFDAVRHLALATSVFNTFSHQKQFALDPEDFWLHSLGAAKACQILSTKHCQIESPEGCFTAGLLHDIGKYLFALVMKEEYGAVTKEAQESQRLLRNVEEETLDTNHAVVGGWLVDKWRFPQVFDDVISHLYSLETYSGPYRQDLALVVLANVMSMKAGFGRAGDYQELDFPPVALQVAGIHHATAVAVSEELAGMRPETEEFLRLLEQE